jgi:hypothetical protein
MNHVRARRWVAGAVATTLLGGLLTLLVVTPAQANHGGMVLEVFREVQGANTGSTVQFTARLQNADGSPALDGSGNGASIDWELYGLAADGEGGADSPLTPDRSCTTSTASVSSPYPNCSVSVTAAVAGRLLVRAWVDEDGSNATAEIDAFEGRLSSKDSDCDTEVENPPATNTGREAACLNGPEQPGDPEEPDDTDVVEVNYRSPAATATTLDCNPNTAVPTGAGEVSFVLCKVTDANGVAFQGAQVDGENLASIQDPDDGDNENPADYNGAPNAENPACTTNASGVCAVRIKAINSSVGAALVCFWIDTDAGSDGQTDLTNPPSFVNESYVPAGSEGDGGGCAAEPAPAAADNGGLTDKENIVFEVPALTAVDVEPDSSIRTVGTAHTMTGRALDQFGRQWKSATAINFEFLSGSVQDTDGSTPGVPDRSCNTPGSGDNPGTCTFSYTSSTTGTDTICGFLPGAPSSACDEA